MIFINITWQFNFIKTEIIPNTTVLIHTKPGQEILYGLLSAAWLQLNTQFHTRVDRSGPAWATRQMTHCAQPDPRVSWITVPSLTLASDDSLCLAWPTRQGCIVPSLTHASNESMCTAWPTRQVNQCAQPDPLIKWINVLGRSLDLIRFVYKRSPSHIIDVGI